MKDCSNCKKKPEAGSVYEKTPCKKCLPWNPTHDTTSVLLQKPDWWWAKLKADD